MKISTENYIMRMNNLRLQRKKLRLTLKDVAEELGISRSALSQYEGLRATLSEKTIKKYENYLEEMEREV